MGARPRPLVVTGDPELLDDLLRLAAAENVETTVASDGVAAQADWSSAPLVVVGSDRVTELSRLRPAPRQAVIIAARRGGVEPPWPAHADALCAEHIVVLPDAEAWLVDRFADLAAGSPGEVSYSHLDVRDAGGGASHVAVLRAG